jgi:hypothetical protein
MPAFLFVYVDDADETYRRAVAAGAESIETHAKAARAISHKKDRLPPAASIATRAHKSDE